MSAAAISVNAVSRPAVNPWIVATAVVIPTFMEILDTTIATASMRYIAGGLSATMNDSDWVMTSYLAANATISYNFMDYWHVPDNELVFNPPSSSSAPVKNPDGL